MTGNRQIQTLENKVDRKTVYSLCHSCFQSLSLSSFSPDVLCVLWRRKNSLINVGNILMTCCILSEEADYLWKFRSVQQFNTVSEIWYALKQDPLLHQGAVLRCGSNSFRRPISFTEEKEQEERRTSKFEVRRRSKKDGCCTARDSP